MIFLKDKSDIDAREREDKDSNNGDFEDKLKTNWTWGRQDEIKIKE